MNLRVYAALGIIPTTTYRGCTTATQAGTVCSFRSRFDDETDPATRWCTRHARAEASHRLRDALALALADASTPVTYTLTVRRDSWDLSTHTGQVIETGAIDDDGSITGLEHAVNAALRG